jgi:muramoyltetrapeptide carboxypeptidase
MLRKDFLKTIPAAAAVLTVPLNGIKNIPGQVIKPHRLQPGDTIGIIAPGSYITEKELSDSEENLKKLGFNVFYTKNILAKYGYLAGTDNQRAADVHEMFSNKDIKGIICARGGYGCARLLPLLNYKLIENNPKVICGYSDVTALLYGIYSQTGLVCFHGPVGISTYNDYSTECFNRVLVNPENREVFHSMPEENLTENYRLKVIAGGKCRGITAGGNLSIVTSMAGTPYDIDTDGKIVFLEETGEEPYRIDRMLTQLLQSGKLNKAAGVVMGIFSKCEPKVKEGEADNAESFTLMEVLADRLGGLNIPVIYGMSFGHVTNKMTIPVGIEMELDTADASLTLAEPAVI